MHFSTAAYILATSLALSQALPGPLAAGNTHWCGDWAGQPSADDVPSGQQLPRSDYTKRLFVEPQLQKVPFSPSPPLATEPKVQVPKIWGNNKFRVALMSYTEDQPTRRIYSSSKSRWADFHAGLQLVMNECVAKGSGGAALIPPSPGLGQSTLTVYVYEVGSQFDFQMNYYMSEPYGINPANIGGGADLSAARVPVDTA